MLNRLRQINEPREILSCDSPDLSPYGRLIGGIDCRDMFDPVEAASIEGTPTYVRHLNTLEGLSSIKMIKQKVYGKDTVLQVGICFGMNDRMNGMEYHRGSEVIVALTDAVLILGRVEEIRELYWDSSLARCFYLPQGTVLELYEGTLHLAPCRVTEKPFRTVIILPEGTNKPLDEKKKADDPSYFMENKWLLCHRESPAVEKGALVGISGENIIIHTI